VGLVATVVLLNPVFLNAQELEHRTPLEEIIVTAGFHQDSLMSTSASVSIIDDASIESRGAQHLESVLNISANINYSGGASRARFLQVRGIGDLEQFVDPKHFPSIGITMNGINLGGAANSAMLFDVEQIEILRGPQGTRFGGSALGGVVNILGKRPTEILEGYIEVGAGNYGSWNVDGVISGALSDIVNARLAAQHNKSQGYISNTFLNRDDTDGHNETSVRGTFHINPSKRSRYNITAFYFDGKNGYDAFSLDNTRETLSDQPGQDNQANLAFAGEAEWQLGESSTLQANAAWLESDLNYGFDEDWTFIGICDGALCDPVSDFFSHTDSYLRKRNDLSLDMRLLGNLPISDAQYVIGLYAERKKENLHRKYYGDFFSFYEVKRRAIYGHLTIPLNQGIGLTAGIRYEKFGDSYRDTYNFVSVSDDTLRNGELTMTYQTIGSSFFYATVSRGSKPGGVNTVASSNIPLMRSEFQAFMRPRLQVGTETLLNRELGIKGIYFDDQIIFRAALFHMDRNNAQLESWMWDGKNFLWIGFLDNVDGYTSGAEIELSYQFSARAELFGSLGWLKTKIKEITIFDLDRGDFVVRNNIDQAKSPAWQFNLGTKISLSEELDFRVELEGQDNSRFGYYHAAGLDSYLLMNASFRYRLGAAELQIWGRNLTNEDYAIHGLYFGNDPRKGWTNESYYQYGEPRVFGVGVKYSF